ncbi:response regulator protein [alpha proteobacterium U9-1i]|nr:response regulator protein [alpha proteobacterium U9-1i]
MRIVVRSSNARAAREAQDFLRIASIEATAMTDARAAPDGQDMLIVPALDGDIDQARAFAADARASKQPPLAVLAGVRWADAPPKRLAGDPDFSGAIALDAPPDVLAAQVTAYERVAIASEESARRGASAAEANAPTPAPPEARKLKALYVGAPSPIFLKLEHTLAEQGGLVAAAFSSFAGFDHLHDDEFDAVVLNGAQNPATAISLCAALRRNAQLYHLPTMVVVAPDDTATAKSAFDRGASSVSTVNASSGASLGWLFEAIRRNRARKAAEHTLRALRDLLGDPRTGLFRRQHFNAHLSRLAADHHESGRQLALAALRVLPAHGATQPSAEVWKRGFTEIASLTGRLIREYDCAAVIGEDLIALAMPASDVIGAKRMAERIASVAECTAFAAGDDGAVPLIFEQSAVELQPGESGAGLLARALRLFENESLSA